MNAKNDVTKLACALQTILSVLICACVIIVGIAKRFYTKKKEKLNKLLFKSMF